MLCDPDPNRLNFRTIKGILFTFLDLHRSLPQVEYFFEKYGMVYSLDQRDEYGHSPAHWVALNGHAHITRYRIVGRHSEE
jgi:ankyrin repeat protein